MKLLTAKEIKKILIGITISDGCIDVANQRFDFYTKHEDYAKYVTEVLSQITGMEVRFKVKHDKRGYTGYRVWTAKHAYWNTMSDYIYNGRKELNTYTVSRLDAEALAHVWMCDGYLEHRKNRTANKIQNIGWVCFEAFPVKELELLSQHLFDSFGINSSLIAVKWGFGYRLRLGGFDLQKFLSLVYPYILPVFLYKTELFFKSEKYVDRSLSNAERIIKVYSNVEDIVRHS